MPCSNRVAQRRRRGTWFTDQCQPHARDAKTPSLTEARLGTVRYRMPPETHPFSTWPSNHAWELRRAEEPTDYSATDTGRERSVRPWYKRVAQHTCWPEGHTPRRKCHHLAAEWHSTQFR